MLLALSSGACSWGAWLESSGDPGTSAGSLACRVRVSKNLGLLPTPPGRWSQILELVPDDYNQDGRVEGRVPIFSCKNSKITTGCWTTIDRRWLDPIRKGYPRPRTKEKPQKDGRRGKTAFRLKLLTPQSCMEGSNKTLYAPGHRDPTETEPDLPLNVSCEGMGQQWPAAGALGAADLSVA